MTNREIEKLIKRDLKVDAKVIEQTITVSRSYGTTRHLVLARVGDDVLYFIATSYGDGDKAAFAVDSYAEGKLYIIHAI